MFFLTKPTELLFSSVNRGKPYIFGANQNRNRLNLSAAKYYPLVSAKINRTYPHHGQTV